MVRLPVLLQNCFFSEGGGYELNLPTTVPDNTPSGCQDACAAVAPRCYLSAAHRHLQQGFPHMHRTADNSEARRHGQIQEAC